MLLLESNWMQGFNPASGNKAQWYLHVYEKSRTLRTENRGDPLVVGGHQIFGTRPRELFDFLLTQCDELTGKAFIDI
jgi:hypothetical protein